MLNKGLLVQIAVAYTVSAPIAYYIVKQWLEGFAYKTPMYWWVSVLGGFIILSVSVLTVSWESYMAASMNPVTAIKTE
ncbi:MAG: hypothetical protein LBG92_09975 [Prevotellaceae bacterium]|jgi:putative ABC transport system permease protein|nr:hypothetical protein [Prevotellaceae bacterium]